MFKAKKGLESSSKSNCKVGKITSLKKVSGDTCTVQIDLKTDTFKKSK